VQSQHDSTDRFDAVIIGSGMGSLTTAAILADQGWTVLVLEKHSQLGGYTQGFQRESWYWDVAVHYICSMEPGDVFFHGCRYLTENELRWKRMPHIFDHFCFPDFQVDVPSSPEEYRDHLKSLFPNEHRQIDRYFGDLNRFQRRLAFLWAPKLLPVSVAKVLRPVLKLLFRKIPECSTADYFEQIGCSEKLTAAICAPWGTFGGLPSESSIYEHWLTPGSYLYGAWYPAGGAASIAGSLAKFIENRGGLLRTSAGVKEILLDASLEKATGVKLESGEVIEGEMIISGIGVRQTFAKLLPKQSTPSEILDLLADYENSVSYAQLFAGLNSDPSVIPGIDGSNYWIASTTEFPPGIKELQSADDDKLAIRSVMLTFPSLKDPDAKSQTLTICAWIDYGFFSQWAETESLQRPDDYEAMKRKLTDALLRPVLSRFPQLREFIEYVTVSTPLTAEHYTGNAEGSAYGLASPPGRFNDDRLRPQTRIDRLYLTGSDIACSGVPGAFAGGVFCASAILKKNMAPALIRLDKAHYGDASYG
jgi:all-trans-retinol 13,14-reductase